MPYRSFVVPSFLALAFCFLGGCVNAPEESAPPPTYLFEITNINRAWGYQHSGRYIDSDGNLWSYKWKNDKQNAWKGYADPMAITSGELWKKYERNRRLIARLDAGELAAMTAKIHAASQGKYTDHVNTANDAGGSSSVAFLYNPATHTYREVELEASGDWSHYNRSPDAIELARWLNSLPR